jgi:hypothetical protein
VVTSGRLVRELNVRQKSSRDKQIVQLRSRGLTLKAIGQQFGITRERVRQIVSRYPITRRLATVPDLMARFGVKRYEIQRAMKRAGLGRRPRRGNRYVLSDADVATIAAILSRQEDRKCLICGRSLEGRVRRSRRFCSLECFHQYRRQKRQSQPSKFGKSARTRRIQQLLASEPPGSNWVTLKLAARLSGMSRNQLSWLRWRGLIACVPSKMRSRSGGPRMLYSARHCELLRRIIAPH